jgi:hypothetical protein
MGAVTYVSQDDFRILGGGSVFHSYGQPCGQQRAGGNRT